MERNKEDILFYGRYFMFDVVANYHTRRRKQVMNDPERIERGAPV